MLASNSVTVHKSNNFTLEHNQTSEKASITPAVGYHTVPLQLF